MRSLLEPCHTDDHFAREGDVVREFVEAYPGLHFRPGVIKQ